MAYDGPQDNAEGLDTQRTINYSVYCERCGYNLRYGRYIGRCNECGNPYNARPLVMQGVFNPHTHRFPTTDVLLTLLCFGFAYWVIRANINPPVAENLAGAGLFVFLGLLSLPLSIKRLSLFIRSFGVLRRIEQEEDD